VLSLCDCSSEGHVVSLTPNLRSKRFRSIGLSAGLKYFSFFERTKIGASARKCAPSINVAFTPIFAPPKSEGCLERAEKPTETLAVQAI